MRYLRNAPLLFIVLTGMLLVTFVTVQGDANAAKQDDIRKLLRLMKTREIIEQSINQTVVNMKQAMPNVTADTWERVMNEIDLDEMVEMYVPIYDKYLSHEDIKGLIQFYQTDLGKRYVDVQPEINLEAMRVGQVWGQKLGQKVMSEMGH